MSGISPDAAADSVVDAYLQAVAARLAGPRRARVAILDELRDGLLDDVEHHRQRGLSPLAAAWGAVARFGTPDVIAAAFASELGAMQARRTVLAFLATGPIVGLLWLGTLAPDRTPAALLSSAPALGPIIAAGTLAGLFTLVATGRLSRWLPRAPRLPLAGATMTCLTACMSDLTVLTLLADRLLATPRPTGAFVAAPAAISAVRLCCSWDAIRRCRAAEASIT